VTNLELVASHNSTVSNGLYVIIGHWWWMAHTLLHYL